MYKDIFLVMIWLCKLHHRYQTYYFIAFGPMKTPQRFHIKKNLTNIINNTLRWAMCKPLSLPLYKTGRSETIYGHYITPWVAALLAHSDDKTIALFTAFPKVLYPTNIWISTKN